MGASHRLRLVVPVAGSATDAGVRFELFPTSPELRPAAEGGLLHALLAGGLAGAGATEARLADAVALAAITASERERRRMVLLVLDGDGGDASQYRADAVRRYLERMRVPLLVWSTAEPTDAVRAAWGAVARVDSTGRLERAARALAAHLDRQRVVWVEGRHLPQRVVLPPEATGFTLAGAPASGAPLDPADGTEQDDASEAGGVEGASVVPAANGERADDLNIPDELAAVSLGPFTAASDVVDRRLLARLGEVASALPAAYAHRFGLQPAPAGRVLLFRREASFRDWLASRGAPSDSGLEGLAESGAAALYVGDRRAEEVAGLLVHELTHLLTRSAAGRLLPAWLEEGLAEDLAMSRLDASGRPQPGTLRVTRTQRPLGGVGPGATVVERTVEGPAAALARLVSIPGARVPLAALLDANHEELVAPAGRRDRYATAAFLVRFLLAPREGRAERFRDFLATVAAGGEAGSVALGEALGEPLPEVERAFAEWLRRTAASG
jgi:hypothetical protein